MKIDPTWDSCNNPSEGPGMHRQKENCFDRPIFSARSCPAAGSHLSEATLPATPTALILRGCVQIMLHFPPSP